MRIRQPIARPNRATRLRLDISLYQVISAEPIHRSSRSRLRWQVFCGEPYRKRVERAAQGLLWSPAIPSWYENGTMTRVRMDKWLWAARFVKTRSLAERACELGGLSVGLNSAEFTGTCRQGSRFEESCGPEPFVHSYAGHRSILRYFAIGVGFRLGGSYSTQPAPIQLGCLTFEFRKFGKKILRLGQVASGNVVHQLLHERRLAHPIAELL